MKFYVLGNFSGFRKWQNSVSGSDKTEILVYKLPITLHSLVELIHNSTNANEQKKLDKSMPLKKSLNVFASGTPKSRGFSVFAL